MIARLGPVASILLALALWQAAVTFGDLPAFILPGPDRVASALWTNRALIA